MSFPESSQLVIDARPRGPRGLLAVEQVLGRSVLERLVDQVVDLGEGTVVIHARHDEHAQLQTLLQATHLGRWRFATGTPSERSPVLRTDRLYDSARLRRALKRSKSPETAVLWKLDGPHGLRGAEDELIRRRTYQPLGHYWALAPARALARVLRPTRVRPNALTIASAVLMAVAAATVAFAPYAPGSFAITAIALALALVIDTADGHLARLQGTASEFGRWLDGYLDELSDMLLHAAIAWAAYARTGHVAWLVAGMAYGMGKYLFVAGAAIGGGAAGTGRYLPAPHGGASRRATAAGGRSEEDGTELRPALDGNEPATEVLGDSIAVRAMTTVVRAAGHADLRWHLWIVLAALGRLDWALAAYTAYFPARSLGAAIRRGVRRA